MPWVAPLLAAFVGGIAVLAATLWLDGRAAIRDQRADQRATLGDLMVAVATARGALAVANSTQENGARMQAVSSARQERRALTGIMAVAETRLRRDLRAAGMAEGTRIALDVLPEVIWPALDQLHRCALLGRDRLRRPEGGCLTPEIIATSLRACEAAVLTAMDATLAAPATAGVRHDETRATCLGLPGLPVAP